MLANLPNDAWRISAIYPHDLSHRVTECERWESPVFTSLQAVCRCKEKIEKGNEHDSFATARQTNIMEGERFPSVLPAPRIKSGHQQSFTKSSTAASMSTSGSPESRITGEASTVCSLSSCGKRHDKKEINTEAGTSSAAAMDLQHLLYFVGSQGDLSSICGQVVKWTAGMAVTQSTAWCEIAWAMSSHWWHSLAYAASSPPPKSGTVTRGLPGLLGGAQLDLPTLPMDIDRPGP